MEDASVIVDAEIVEPVKVEYVTAFNIGLFVHTGTPSVLVI